jgi:hypothetical protein
MAAIPPLAAHTGSAALAALAATGAKPAADHKAKARAMATDFEATFLNSMFGQMFTAVDGEGPFGVSRNAIVNALFTIYSTYLVDLTLFKLSD